MTFSLKEVYNYIFPPKSKLGFERVTTALGEKLNIICAVSKFTDIEELKTILAEDNFNFINDGKNSSFHTFRTSYIKYSEFFKKEVKIDVEFKLYIDRERDLLLFFTTSNKFDVEKTLCNFIERQYGFYYAFLSPLVFDIIKEKILLENLNAIIPYFRVIRKPHYKLRSKIRPKEERSFTYQSGSDGRETLEEFKELYGMLPRIVEFEIPGLVNFRIDYRGIISFKKGKIEYIDKILDFIVSSIVKSKKIIEKSKVDIIEIVTEKKKLKVPKVLTWTINFSKPIEIEEIENIIFLLSKYGNFRVTDSYMEKGSLLWSATITDYQKNSIFNIKSNGIKLSILPRYEPKFDSFLRFYQFFVENIDTRAAIEGVN